MRKYTICIFTFFLLFNSFLFANNEDTSTSIDSTARGSHKNYCTFTETLKLSPQLSINCDNNTATYEIYVDHFTNMIDAQFAISYDTSKLEYISGFAENIGYASTNLDELGQSPSTPPAGSTESAEHVWVDFSWNSSNPAILNNGDKILTLNFALKDYFEEGVTGIASIGTSYPIRFENHLGQMTPSEDFIIDPTIYNRSEDQSQPVLIGNCENINTEINNSSSCDATVSFDVPIFRDYCSGISLINYSVNGAEAENIPSGTTTLTKDFPLGENTVLFTAADGNNNIETCRINVIVSDNQALSVECPSDISYSTLVGNTTEQITLPLPRIEDNCEGDYSYTYSYGIVNQTVTTPTEFTFPVGITTVTVTASNGRENASCTFTVNITADLNNQLIQCPQNVVACNRFVEAIDPIYVGSTNSESIILNHVIQYNGSSVSGTGVVPSRNFALGTTFITYVATDGVTTDQCTFSVTIDDDTPPNITCPNSVTESIAPNATTGLITLPLPNASDDCNSDFTYAYSYGSIDQDVAGPYDFIFPLGVTTVTATVDNGMQESSCNFDVTVIQREEVDLIECIGDTNTCRNFIDNLSPNYLLDVQNLTLTHTIEHDGTSSNGDGPIMNRIFEYGSTTITYFATDGINNDTCTFTITIEDNTPPSIICPSDILRFANQTDSCGIVVNYDLPLFEDECDPTATMICTPPSGSFFPIGETTVKCIVMDAANNKDSCEFQIKVEDNLAPSIICPGNPIIVDHEGNLISGNPNFVLDVEMNTSCDQAVLHFANPMVEDNCLDGVNMNQISGPNDYDLVVLDQPHTFEFSAEDASGNTSEACNFTVEIQSPGLDINQNGDGYCVGSVMTLSVDSVPGATYFWALPSGQFINGSELSINNVAIESQGTYQVNQTLNECVTTETIVIDNIYETPSFIINISGEGCDEEKVLSLGSLSHTLDSIVWTGPNNLSSRQNNLVVESPGTYSVVGYIGTCSYSESVDVSGTGYPSIEIESDCIDNTICVNQPCTLIGTSVDGATSNWRVQDGCNIVNLSSNNETATISLSSQGTCTIYYWLSSEGCNSDTIAYEVNAISTPIAVNDQVYMSSNMAQININVLENDSINPNILPRVNATSSVSSGDLTYQGDGVFTYVVIGTPSVEQFQYEICYDVCSNLCDRAIVSIALQDTSCLVPTLITPNDDGFNDVLEISCFDLAEYPDSEMTIYNQWGDQIFYQKPYTNNTAWDGTYKGKPVSDGTYYFVFKREENSAIQKGYITVYR